MEKKNKLRDLLERHGIHDAAKYLADHGDSAKVGPSAAPDVRVRGSIHLMKKRKTSRSDIDKGLASLKYL